MNTNTLCDCLSYGLTTTTTTLMLRTRKEKIPLLQNSIKKPNFNVVFTKEEILNTAKFSQMYHPRVGLIMKKSGFETYFIIGPTLIFMIEPTLP